MTDKMREEFEAWFTKTQEHEYCSENVKRIMLDAWQASRAALVVELPKARCDIDYGYELNDIQNLLTDSGISYK